MLSVPCGHILNLFIATLFLSKDFVRGEVETPSPFAPWINPGCTSLRCFKIAPNKFNSYIRKQINQYELKQIYARTMPTQFVLYLGSRFYIMGRGKEIIFVLYDLCSIVFQVELGALVRGKLGWDCKKAKTSAIKPGIYNADSCAPDR